MNWQHLQTLLWLRWRLTYNHVRKHGMLNLIILSIGGGLSLLASIAGFFGALIAGCLLLPAAPPVALMYLWDGLVMSFVFFWAIGVMAELQRSEMLSLDKLLHLPTSLAEVFVFNYLSSLVSLTTLTFIPPMLGLALASVYARGPSSLVQLPLLAGFIFMISAVTYQFRGWLATLMVNKRRQRTVVAVVTMGFIVFVQLPQLINIAFQGRRLGPDVNQAEHLQAQADLRAKLASAAITVEQFQQKLAELEAEQKARKEASQQAFVNQIHETAGWVNLVLPIGWIAYGSQAAAAGNPWPGAGFAAAMLGISALSLWRSYHTTLRYFTGSFTSGAPRGLPATTVAVPAVSSSAGEKPSPTAEGNLIERSLPLASEPVSAVACSTLQAMLRAPEVKMVLLGPLIMLLLFGGMLFANTRGKPMPLVGRSFMPLGVLGLSIAGMAQLALNVFGFDRSGFRAYVLSGVARRDILLGKNLALGTLVVAIALPLLVIVQILVPAPVTHFLATLLEVPSALLALCLLGNISSILTPICQASGSLKPASSKGVTLLLQFLFGMSAFGVLSVVAVVPVGLELLLQHFQLLSPLVPLALILAIVELTAALLLYRLLIDMQGNLLQQRECRILEVVTEKGE